MGNTVIVALPSVDDKVFKLSSEKVPHMTLISLGDLSNEQEALVNVVEFIEHAAQFLSPFGLTVDHRGELGPNRADVLFFEEAYGQLKQIRQFRHDLLGNEAINRGFLTSDQFPEWTPHLMLGYPETPAHADTSEYPGVHHVSFDRIAVWMGDYTGPEFRLQYPERGMEVSMSDTQAAGLEAATDVLEHYGVKGMRWGVTREDRAAQRTPTDVQVVQKKPGTFAKATGGKNHEISDDAKLALEGRQKAKASTTDALSNAELRKVVERMNLEQQYSQLAFQSDRRSKGARFLAGFLGQKRYNGEKRKFTDSTEDFGEKAAGTAAGIGNVIKEAAKRAA